MSNVIGVKKVRGKARKRRNVTTAETELCCEKKLQWALGCQPNPQNADIPPPLYDIDEVGRDPDLAQAELRPRTRTPVPSYDEIPLDSKPQPMISEEKSFLLPSYSAIMKKPNTGETYVDTFHPPAAPPTYNDVPGVCVIPSSPHIERLYHIPTIPEPLWRSRSQPAHCPRCDLFVFTTTRTHETPATHLTALALCLFGCWPCCLLPYCLNVCKNTYHICPICRGYLGAYTPW